MKNTSDRENVSASAGDSRLVRKPVELICCAPGQSLSFMQRRIITAICDAAVQFQDTDVICFAPRELSLAIHNGGENLRALHKASAAMRDLKAWLNPLDERSPPDTLGIFEEVTCSSNEILFRLNPRIGQSIRVGECFVEVDPLIEKKLSAANAVALYELAALFLRRHERPTFRTARWRQLITGSVTKENERFVTTHIILRSAAALETHARIRPAVVRPRGPRVDLVRVEFRKLSRSVCTDAAHEAPPADHPCDQDSPGDGIGEDAPTSSLNGVDAFEQLLDTWNSQFGGTGHSSGRELDAIQVDSNSPSPASAVPGGCDEIVSAWREAQGETMRLKEQLLRAELLERKAALRALRIAVQRYRATPDEVFGAAAPSEDPPGAPPASPAAAGPTLGDVKWTN